jgi:hypothetical protein
MGSIRFTATNGTVRVIYQWTDANNYCCVEWTHTSSKLRARAITRRNGTESVKLSSEKDHTLDSDEVFDFCAMFSTGGDTNTAWTVETILASQTDGTFALPATATFTFNPSIPETGVAGFNLNGSCTLQSWDLWKTSLDDMSCENCYGCNLGEVFDDFEGERDLLLRGSQAMWSGQWEQDFGGTFKIKDGLLQSESWSNAFWCWKRDTVEGFSVLAQVTLNDFVNSGWYGVVPERIQFLLSGNLITAERVIGFVAIYDPGTNDASWHAVDFDDAVNLNQAPAAGDVLKLTAVRTAVANEYDLEWYINNTLVRSHTTSPGSQVWDWVLADQICLGGVWEQSWDDFYFLSNATPST